MTNLTRYEMETVVNYNAGEQTATVYTRDKAVMRRLDQLAADYPEIYKLVKQTDIDKTYSVPKSYISFYRIPKQLFTDRQFDVLSVEAKLLYGMMIDRMELSQKNGWIDSQGRAYIYFTVDEVKDRLHCANDKAVRLMRELGSGKGIGLIESVRQGLGKPNIIYVKNFVSGETRKGRI